ncbi:hypothetical protein M2212_006203 [Bradyrhizobium elkanii]|jgi:hypothetical protein|uniref:hypothetical protein n=1 Tax=Bradyrhizobium elkanii TaxID=29448 RepID=UPI00216A6B1B|nr:hypothetical protein [Bradyrhizobium elkanii]MCS3479357.1 hypothetical protein [Bradyrhizobium elkanii]
MSEPNEYDLFLQTWEPGARLVHASLPQNLSDPFSRKRLLDDSTGSAPVARTPFAQGQKVMASEETIARAYEFFRERHVRWSAEFRDYVLARNVPEEKLDAFVTSFATLWIDGRKRRQDSPEMLAIKASIRDFDRLCRPDHAGRFVINPIDGAVPLFTPTEMAAIFEANNGLIDAFLPDYVDHLGDDGPGSLDDLYVRRGVYMPAVDRVRRELHYLSSYSLTLGPVEQFAQTWTPATQGIGEPSIFSAPLPAIQHRVVAFAPFIAGMDLSQLEFVVAPPIEEMPLQDDGVHGGIHEFSFR